MLAEYNALLRNNTWLLVPPATDQNLISCKWIFRIKTQPDDSIERYKARLVARGFQQRPGIDFGKTYSPVLKPTTLRLILSLAVSQNWPVRQLDIANAFLHGSLSEPVNMQKPPGFVDQARPDHVCHLRKSLYGLKQALRAWFHCLRQALESYGFKGSKTDPSLFILRRGAIRLYFLVYVGDILLTGNQGSALHPLLLFLQGKFVVRDLGRLNYFLGVQAHWTPTGLLLTQQRYIQAILDRAKMSNANSLSTPAAPATKDPDMTPFSDPSLYRQIVGALQYLQFTRPDISHAVNFSAQHMHNPLQHHWSDVKRIHLNGTSTHGLFFNNTSPLLLSGYYDAAWANSVLDRRSTTGYAVYLGCHLIS
ncbi:unnamed protein product [Linum trigynum]|uniref:Reverse transcriptase Ty1/copia-type domain-containing protein n=1 Tax=Linum trigynum TaxID=586398 RepID=A0AAV2F5X9_9ROSI